MSTKAVFFDVGGVIISCDLERYVPIGCEIFRTTEDALRKQVAEHVRDLEKGRITSHQFWSQVSQGLGVVAADGRTSEFDEDRLAHLWSDLMLTTLQVNWPLIRLCQTLACDGVIVGALSNTIEEHVAVCEERGLYIPFNPLLLSCRLGVRKPEDAIFKLACKQAHVHPQECLFVDDVADNLAPARMMGMKVHQYTGMDALLQCLRKLRLVREVPWYVPSAQPALSAGAGELVCKPPAPV